MGMLDKFTRFLKGEASDIGEAADQLKDRFDEELTRREAELAKTPSEKIDDLKAKASETDDEFDRILAKADAAWAPDGADEDAEPTDGRVADPATASPEPGTGAPPAAKTSTGSTSDGVNADAPKQPDPADPAQTGPGHKQRPVPNFAKSDAEMRYQEARDKADGLLAELRSELKDNGDI